MELIDKQINFYNQLSDEEKEIIRAIGVKLHLNYAKDLGSILNMGSSHVYDRKVNAVFNKAVAEKILISPESRYTYIAGSHIMSVSFLVFIFPLLEKHERAHIKWDSGDYSYEKYKEENIIFTVRRLLNEMLYGDKVSEEDQNLILNHRVAFPALYFLTYPVYIKNSHKLSDTFLNKMYVLKFNELVFNLQPLHLLQDLYTSIVELLPQERINAISNPADTISFFKGEFDKILERDTLQDMHSVHAITSLLQGDFDTSLRMFDEVINYYRKEYPGINMPGMFFLNYLYFVLLMCIDRREASHRAKKIFQTINRIKFGPMSYGFEAVVCGLLDYYDDMARMAQVGYDMVPTSSGLDTLLLFILGYLVEVRPPLELKEHFLATIDKAWQAGNHFLAYDAAFVATKWYNDDQTMALYKKIAASMHFKPAVSRIYRPEKWEKSYNMLLNTLNVSKKSAVNEMEMADKHRLIYYVNLEEDRFQPVLQTRNAKGNWSKGRKVAMKTLFEGDVPGMTERDYRISKCITRYSGSYAYPENYMFNEKLPVELIGHPLLFLDGTDDVPVEFVAAKPEVIVTKKPNGYAVSSNVNVCWTNIFVEKETNTRYKVYNLKKHIVELLKIIDRERMVVPEDSKDMLTDLLMEISKHVTVQSDLLSSDENGQAVVRKVESDSRIRLQLIPFGDGLKAELFVKPFNEFPPYAKPGAGGNVLITTSTDGEQLQTKRDFAKEKAHANRILNDIQKLESVNMSEELISFEEPLDSLYLLDILALHRDICVVEWPQGERFKIKSCVGFNALRMQVKSKINWFELVGKVQIDENTVVTLQQLLAMMNNKHGNFIELNDGEFIALTEELRKYLDELYSYAKFDKNKVQLNKFASMTMGDFFDNIVSLKTDDTWKRFQKRIKTADNIKIEVPALLQAELRPYQEDGFRWMARLAELECGACLADDMGLGKTLQTLAILLHRAQSGPALVVCPVSVVGNWINEATRFAPTLNMKMLGNTDRKAVVADLKSGDVLVTSYGLLQSEEDLLAAKEFATIVLDEAHIIKNYATKTSKAIMQLKGAFRLALTGTPLQNHMGEIWNLFNFINPGLLGTLTHFNDNFIKPDNTHSRQLLRQLIRPFILRRTKTDVLRELPAKTEIVKKIRLSDTEMAFYEALRRQALLNLENGNGNQGGKHMQALAEITKLRQASCNPLLVDEKMKIESSKLTTFLEIIDELRENNHRALVFSQFVSHLAIVRNALDEKGVTYQYLDGSTSMQEREKSVAAFQSGTGDLFLISLKAGGLGLNLTAADFVLHLDPWWNPAIEDQASDRAHRFGQQRPVTIYRLVAENTIEEKILELHNTKRDLAESLLEGSDRSAKLSLHELVELIREGM